jgi:hypothetical protein
MNHDELLEALDVTQTVAIGDDLWMTDVLYLPGAITFARNVLPMKVRVTGYDADSTAIHVNLLKKNGEPRAAYERSRYSPNTEGDDSAHFFLTEQEAKESYRAQAVIASARIDEAQDAVNERFVILAAELES